MRLALGVVAIVCGCNPPHDAPTVDAGPGRDTPPLDADLGYCSGWAPFALCMETLPTEPLTLAAGTIDTDTSPLCAPDPIASWTAHGQPDACFLIGTSITVPMGAAVAFTGARPVVMLAAGTMAGGGRDGTLTIGGAVDVSSHASTVGAGANSSACNAGTPPGTGGGGAGGSFYSRGATGGGTSAVASGGSSAPAVASMVLRGGCAGQAGDAGGAGGNGGGAIYIATGGAFQMLAGASLDASGQGGSGGSANGAGGGGGSGGMIVVFAGLIVVPPTAFVLDDGGGGGGGASTATDGGTGFDAVPGLALPTGATAVAPGGQGCYVGSTSSNGGDGATASAGGGGGGGGCGYVLTSDNDIGG